MTDLLPRANGAPSDVASPAGADADAAAAASALKAAAAAVTSSVDAADSSMQNNNTTNGHRSTASISSAASTPLNHRGSFVEQRITDFEQLARSASQEATAVTHTTPPRKRGSSSSGNSNNDNGSSQHSNGASRQLNLSADPIAETDADSNHVSFSAATTHPAALVDAVQVTNTSSASTAVHPASLPASAALQNGDHSSAATAAMSSASIAFSAYPPAVDSSADERSAASSLSSAAINASADAATPSQPNALSSSAAAGDQSADADDVSLTDALPSSSANDSSRPLPDPTSAALFDDLEGVDDDESIDALIAKYHQDQQRHAQQQLQRYLQQKMSAWHAAGGISNNSDDPDAMPMYDPDSDEIVWVSPGAALGMHLLPLNDNFSYGCRHKRCKKRYRRSNGLPPGAKLRPWPQPNPNPYSRAYDTLLVVSRSVGRADESWPDFFKRVAWQWVIQPSVLTVVSQVGQSFGNHVYADAAQAMQSRNIGSAAALGQHLWRAAATAAAASAAKWRRS